MRKFRTSFSGYNKEDVNEFVSEVIQAYEDILQKLRNSTKEMELLVRHVELAPKELKNIVIAGFKSGFFPGSYIEKRRFVRKVIDKYNELAKAYQIPLY